MAKRPNIEPKKFWAFNVLQDNSDTTELLLYSDIADEKSYDWFSGERGNEATPTAFREELNAIESNNICVRINSYGGSVFAASAIATQLKDLINNGKNITCKIDGICASAAVLVALACKNIAIAPTAYMMIHNPMLFVCDYMNADEMEKLADTLNTLKDGIIAAYVERTGLTAKECSKMMSEETWFTGAEAVEKGFADEILETPRDQVDNYLNRAFVNLASCDRFVNAPKALKKAFENKNIIKEGEEPMEQFKNYEELQTAYPELCKNALDKAREDGKADGVQSELNRIKAIDALTGKIDTSLLNEAKYGEVKMTADEVIIKAFKEDKLRNRAYLNAAEDDTKPSDEIDGDIDADDEKEDDKEKEAENILKTAAMNCRIKGGKK